MQKVYGTGYFINPELEEYNSFKKLTGTKTVNFNEQIQTITIENNYYLIINRL